MGRGVKSTLVLIIVVYTMATFYLTYQIGMIEYQELQKLGDLMNQVGGI